MAMPLTNRWRCVMLAAASASLFLALWSLKGQATMQHVITANGNSMAIGYIAPTSAACTEQAASDPGFSTIILNQTGASGLRWRYFSVIGLSPSLTYYYRTTCGGNTASGQFTMPAANGANSAKLNFTVAPMPNIGNVDGISLEWGSSPGALTSSAACTCTVAGCSLQFGSVTDMRQDTLYYLRYKWTLAGVVKATSIVQPVAVRAGAPITSPLVYTSPRCIPGTATGYSYAVGTGTSVNGWYGLDWNACGDYPTTTPPALSAAACPTSSTPTNSCTPGYTTTLIDPDTGNRILRVTQSGSLNNVSGGNQFYVADAGWSAVWNADGTKIMFQGDGTRPYWVGFNPDDMSVTGQSGLLSNHTSWGFSGTDPDVAYYNNGNAVHKYVFSTNTDTTLFNITTVPYYVAGQNIVAVYSGGPNVCVYTGTSGQNTGKLVICYNTITTNTWVIDSNAGTINGTAITGVTTSGINQLHSIAPGKDGSYVLIDSGYFSDSGCNTSDSAPHAQFMVNLITGAGQQVGKYCYSTHWAMGYAGVMYQSVGSGGSLSLCPGTNDSRGVAYRTFTNMNPVLFPEVSGCFGSPGLLSSTHLSWANNRPGPNANNYPVLVDGYNETAASGVAIAYQCAGCNELGAFEAATVRGTAAYYRFGQTWKTGRYDTPAGCSEYDYTSSMISPNGKYALFKSDWKGGTGTGGPCGGGRRSDIFIMELK